MAKFLEFVLEEQDYPISVDGVCKASQLHDIVRIPKTLYIDHFFYGLLTDDIIGVIDVNPNNASQINVLDFKFITLNK